MTLLQSRRHRVAAESKEHVMAEERSWRDRMCEDMCLHDFRPRTQESYGLAVELFFRWVKKNPMAVVEEDVRRYFLHLREERKLAPSTIHVAVCAIRFFLVHTLQRDWAVLDLLRVNKPRKLPVVLSTTEVRTLLRAVQHPVRRMLLTTLYALGLRLGEGLRLETGDIDAERHMVWVRDGKGARDRGIPLPRPLLARLRTFWKTERPASTTKVLFVGRDGLGPLDDTTVQKTFTAAREDARLTKPATPHTLRHSYASHLLEAGVSLRSIQQVLGHKSLRTTEVYIHVTQPGAERVQEIVDRLMADL
jgi:site-specific recombinase XerD